MESADVDILTAALTDGLPAVEAACAEAFANGVHFADVVLNTRPARHDPYAGRANAAPCAHVCPYKRAFRNLTPG
jgi:hypothetical protein